MQLIKQKRNECTYTSVAMLLGHPDASVIKNVMTRDWTKSDFTPFPEPFDEVPRVPSVHEICETLVVFYNIGLVPFERCPMMTPHEYCPSVSVWRDPVARFRDHLWLGEGLIEGTKGQTGHMVAWDREKVFDPRGYTYEIEDAHKFDFEPTRFWYKLEGKEWLS